MPVTTVSPICEPVRREVARATTLAKEAHGAIEDAARLRNANRRARRDLRRRATQVRRAMDGCTTQVDRFHALRSIPPAGSDGSRSVDPAVWLLHVRYARTRCVQDRAVLVDEYRAYALALARRFQRDLEPAEDLAQVAMEALLLALDRFDPDRRLPFPAFATPTIVGALKRHYRDVGWAVRVPRRIHEIAGPARAAADRLAMELGRQPTVPEVAEAIGVTVEQLLEANDATHARAVTSLDAPIDEARSQLDVLGASDPGMRRAEDRVALRQALSELDERDRDLLRLYFFDELSQTQIAARYGVSQMQVSRWLSSALRRLRGRMPNT
ncbi:MAG: sigma-70 family RNA polymerase sigma factor [Actinobacteria bacterium]|nr:sigma-70 family RNA polymerase sigma factor [Actinomycetota bacterium]